MKRRSINFSQEVKKIKKDVVEGLDLPKDILYGAVIVTAMGPYEAYIENYKGIMEYTDCKIKIQTKNCRLEILGKQLLIAYYTNEEMKITGTIQSINYEL